MSKFNFSQSITEINKNGFTLFRLSQFIVSVDKGVPVYEYECEVCNEEGVNITAKAAPLALEALANAIAAIHALELSSPIVEDDCSDLV